MIQRRKFILGILTVAVIFLATNCSASSNSVSPSPMSGQELRRLTDNLRPYFEHGGITDPTLLQELKERAEQRKALLWALLPDNPRIFLFYMLPKPLAANAPESLSALIEKYVDLQGEFVVEVRDDFTRGKAETIYHLWTGGPANQDYILHFVHTPVPVQSGSIIRIQGVLLDHQIIINNDPSQP